MTDRPRRKRGRPRTAPSGALSAITLEPELETAIRAAARSAGQTLAEWRRRAYQAAVEAGSKGEEREG